MTDIEEILADAKPAANFARPPYRVENFSNGFATILNADGINCLTFFSKPGAVLTDINSAITIANKWNEVVDKYEPCEHDWGENGQSEYCTKCQLSFIRYSFTEGE